MDDSQFEEDFEDNMDVEVITMVDDEGNEVEFIIIDALEHNGHNYCLAIENENYDELENSAVIFKEVSEEYGDLVYEQIEDDEEFETIVNLFRENNQDYELDI